MKTVLSSFLILSLFFLGCKKVSDSDEPIIYSNIEQNSDSITYSGNIGNGIHFVREGGGNIDFFVYPTSDSDQLKAIVTKYYFNDTTIELSIDKDLDNDSTFIYYYNTLSGKTTLNGDFNQSELLTGTWSYLYFIYDTSEYEITNTNLRDELLSFETLVKNKIN